MWIVVWYGDEFAAIGEDFFLDLDTKFCDLRDLFPGSVMVTFGGTD